MIACALIAQSAVDDDKIRWFACGHDLPGRSYATAATRDILSVINPWLAAHITAYAEFILPVLLVLGLATRFTALGMLIMTAVIEIFVFPDAWPVHGTWAACFLILMTGGPGVVSLDALIARLYR